MKCKKCKKEISDTATFCKYCGNKIEKSDHELQNPKISNSIWGQKKNLTFVIVVVVAFLLLYVLVFKCRAGVCLFPHGIKGDYCTMHTCDKKGCYNKKAQGKDYCYTHSPSTSNNDYSYTPEKAEDVLSFSDVKVSNNSSYTICTATLTNDGRKTYTYIDVKGKFEDSSGTTLDTDWTYAVGSEGLAPGESVTLKLSVKKNYNIKKCDLEILDYKKE